MVGSVMSSSNSGRCGVVARCGMLLAFAAVLSTAAQGMTYYSHNFNGVEPTADGWSRHNDPEGEWEWGTPSYYFSGGHNGGQCYCTDLNSTYNDNAGCYILSPTFDLAQVPGPMVYFWMRVYTESGYDRFYFQVSHNGGGWVNMPNPTPAFNYGGYSYTGTTYAAWTQVSASLAPYAGGTVRFRFYFYSDYSITSNGVCFDDFSITGTGTQSAVTVSVPDTTLEEPAGDGLVRLTIAPPLAASSVLPLSLTGSAQNGVDYEAIATPVTIPASAAIIDIPLNIIDDSAIEGKETVSLSFSNGPPVVYLAYRLLGTLNTTYTIPDDEYPDISVTTTAPDASEEGPTDGQFTLSLYPTPSRSFLVDFALSGTASSTDYTAVPSLGGQISILPGDGTVPIDVTPVDDPTWELDETLTMSLKTSPDYIVGTPFVATMNIFDNEPEVSISASVATTQESASPTSGAFTVTISPPANYNFTLYYGLAGSTTSGNDYTSVPAVDGALDIDNGDSVKNILITPVDDASYEPTENLVITITPLSNYHINTGFGTATVQILDNEPKATISGIQDGSEDGTPGLFKVYFDREVSSTVFYSVSGTASASSDYVLLSGQVAMVADTGMGTSTGTIQVDVSGDTVGEGTETLQITLIPGTGYGVGSPSIATINIIDDEPEASVSSAGDPLADEEGDGSDTAVFVVSLTPANPAPITVGYAITGTATNGTDYATITGSVAVTSGTGTITITPIDDAAFEGDETVVITLVSGTGYYLAAAPARSAAATITDNEPVASITGTATALQEGDPLQETVTLTITVDQGTGTADVPVDLAFSGTAAPEDYEVTYTATGFTATSPIIVPESPGFVEIDITVIDDNLLESGETAIVAIAPSAEYSVDPTSGSLALTLADNEPTVSVQSVMDASEGADTNGSFTLFMDPTPTQNFPLTLLVEGTASTGTDYGMSSVQAIAGSSTFVITVDPVPDTSAEGDETVIITLQESPFYTVGSADTGTVVITDDEAIVSVAVVNNATEGGADGTFRLSAAVTPAASVNVTFAVTGTAVSGTDYTPLTSPVTIPASGFIDITVTADDGTQAEPTETIILTLSSAAGYSIDPDHATATMDLIDNEPTITVTPSANAIEPTTNGAFTLNLSNAPTTQNLTVSYVVTGSASLGTDYMALSGNAVILVGQTSFTIPVLVADNDDAMVEEDESVVVTLNAGTTYHLGSPSAAAIYIIDAEPVATISQFSDAAEPTTDGVFRLFLTPAPTMATTVRYTVGGTALNGTDYGSLPGTIQFLIGETYKDLLVSPTNDFLAEPDETVVVTVSSNPSYSLATPFTATMLIFDDEPRATIDGTTDASEPNVNGAFTITLSRAPTADVSVSYRVSGSATNGADYEPLSGAAVVKSGETSTSIAVAPIDDNIGEGTEEIVLTLLTGTGYSLNSPEPAAIDLLDNEPTASLSVAAPDGDATANEDGDTGTIVVQLSRLSNTATVVNYAVSGTATGNVDYIALSGSVTIPANQPQAAITVTPQDDEVWEPTELVTVEVLDGTGYIPAAGTVSVLIVDNEPTVTVTATDNEADEDGDPGEFTFTASPAPTFNLTVSYVLEGSATSDQDYPALSATVSIAAGETEATVTVTPTDDLLGEGTETVVATVVSGIAYQAGSGSATISILDNEPLVRIDATQEDAYEEGQVPATLTVTLSEPAPTDLTVYYTVAGSAAPGADYGVLTGQVVILEDETTADITVTPVDDTVGEETEEVRLILAAGSGYIVDGTYSSDYITIHDNEPVATITTVDGSASEDNSNLTGTLNVILTPAPATDVTIAYTVSGSATAGSDYEALTQTLTIRAHTSLASIVVTAIDDAIAEPYEYVVVTLATGDRYLVSSVSYEATVGIADNEPVVSIAPDETGASEPDVPGTFRVTTAAPVASNLTVNYTFFGSALAGIDYNVLSGSVTISANQSSATITVQPIDDRIGEATEYVTVRILTSIGYGVDGSAHTASLGIADDEPIASITAEDSDAYETGSDPGTYIVSLTRAQSLAVRIYYVLTGSAINGMDYAAMSGWVEIPAGRLSAPITIVPIDDSDGEGTEFVEAELVPGLGYYAPSGASPAYVDIYDNEPHVSIVSTQSTAYEGNQDPGELTVVLSHASPVALTVNCHVTGTATPGSDYAALSGSVTIPAGETSAEIVVDVLDDGIVEELEDIVVTLQQGAHYWTDSTSDEGEVHIYDDEPYATVDLIDAWASEQVLDTGDPDLGTFEVRISAMRGYPVVVPFQIVGGTATPADYRLLGSDGRQLNGSVSVPAGSLTATIDVFAVDDSLEEFIEWIQIEVVGTGPGRTRSVDINDNDPPAAVFPYYQDFNGVTAPAGWIANTPWQWGIPTSGPQADHTTGTGKCMGTILAGNYPDSSNAHLTSPAIDIPDDATDVYVGFWMYMDTQDEYDGGVIEISVDGSAFHTMPAEWPFDSLSVPYGTGPTELGGDAWASDSYNQWTPVYADISYYAGRRVRFRFHFASDAFGVAPGWYIDDFMIDRDVRIVSVVSPAPDDYASERESDEDDAMYSLQLDRPAPGDIEVNFVLSGRATEGEDYTLISDAVSPETLSGSVTMGQNTQWANIIVTPIDDNIVEGFENSTLTVGFGIGYVVNYLATHATVTIADDEPLANAELIDGTATEGGSDNGIIRVHIPAPAAGNTIVLFALGGTAIEGRDYVTLGTSIIIPSGATSADLVVIAYADGIAEVDETVTVTVAGITRTITIEGQEFDEMHDIVINEVRTTTGAWIELHNTGTVGIDLTNWFVTAQASGATAPIPSTAVYNFSTNFVIPAGGYVVIHEGGGNDTTRDLYAELPLSIMWNYENNGGSVALYDSASPSNVVDYVVFGLETPVATLNWTGVATQTPTDEHSLARDMYSTDSNQAGDWEITSGANSNTPTPNAANAEPIIEMIEDALGLGGGATCTASSGGRTSAAVELMALFAAVFVAARMVRKSEVAR